jgi:hypothetical protein
MHDCERLLGGVRFDEIAATLEPHEHDTAQRFAAFIEVSGLDRVVDGTGCRLGSALGRRVVLPSVASSKLASLV